MSKFCPILHQHKTLYCSAALLWIYNRALCCEKRWKFVLRSSDNSYFLWMKIILLCREVLYEMLILRVKEMNCTVEIITWGKLRFTAEVTVNGMTWAVEIISWGKVRFTLYCSAAIVWSYNRALCCEQSWKFVLRSSDNSYFPISVNIRLVIVLIDVSNFVIRVFYINL
jgi:hypothetical protein